MKFKSKFQVPALDLSAAKKALEKHMRESVAQAAMEWLDTVLSQVPVWSGASHATFQKLAYEIGYDLTITPVAPDRTGLGASHGYGKLELDPDKGTYKFVYGTSLPHLIWNEYHNANVDPDPTKWPPPAKLHRPGPYMFQVKGADAFERFAKGVGLPKMAPFMKSKSV